MAWSLQFLGYLRTLSLKFQKATSKIEIFLSLPCLGWRPDNPKLNRTETGNLQFCSQPSEVLKLKSSNSNENLGHKSFMRKDFSTISAKFWGCNCTPCTLLQSDAFATILVYLEYIFFKPWPITANSSSSESCHYLLKFTTLLVFTQMAKLRRFDKKKNDNKQKIFFSWEKRQM